MEQIENLRREGTAWIYALIGVPAMVEAALTDMHSFALSERGADDTDGEVKLSKKRKKKDRAP